MNFEDACKSNDKTHGALHRQHNAASFFFLSFGARKLNIAEQLRRALRVKVQLELWSGNRSSESLRPWCDQTV